MLKGFKDFIMRGNVIDLAVAVVIGVAFTAIVTAIVDNLITPILALFMKQDANGAVGITVEGLFGPVTFGIGNIITALISFLAVALVVYFVFVLPMNAFKERQAAKAGIVEEEPELTEQQLLIQIRDLLEKNEAKS